MRIFPFVLHIIPMRDKICSDNSCLQAGTVPAGGRDINEGKGRKNGRRRREGIVNQKPRYDREATEKAWKYYIQGNHRLPDKIDGVRPLVLESWKRSERHAEICSGELRKLSGEELQELLNENALLVQVAYPYLLDFYQWIDNSHLQITLADKHGYQLRKINGSLDPQPEDGLEDGTDFSEDAAGTNGIGTALATLKPVMIFGAEHYQPRYHDMACYAAPIYDPAGNLLGCINITGFLSDWDPMIMSVLQAAVSGIQKEFELTRKNHMLDTLIESVGEGVIMLDRDRNILFCNGDAASLLHLSEDELQGKSVYSVICREKLPEAVRDFSSRMTDEDCTFYTPDGEAMELNVTIRPGGEDPHGMNSTLILIRSQKDVHRLTSKLAGFSAVCRFDSVIGTSPAMQTVVAMGKIAADRRDPVLLFGEKGTGKHMLAQAIHNAGAHPDRPFVELNCASTPGSILPTELFGNEDPETGVSIPGRIRLAEGGTLFLDEISALPEELQGKLVRVLKKQNQTFEGGGAVRLIASSSENLLSLIQTGVFREDLYYLLSSMTITIPPLRERPEDIKVSAEQFAMQITGHPVRITDDACEALEYCSWPGNTRQLEECIRLSVHSAAQENISINDLPTQISDAYFAGFMREKLDASAGTQKLPPETALHEEKKEKSADHAGRSISDAHEYYQLTQALRAAGGNVQQTAELLGIPASSLYRRLRKQNIRAKDYRKLT
jgi:PAS domain S-box-containing protein